MKRIYFFILPLIFATLVLILHVYGMEHQLYAKIWWYDIILHFLGGVSIALFARIFSKKWWVIVGTVFCAAIAWEIFEYIAGIAVLPGQSYWPDTIKDICMGTLGSIFACVSFKNIQEHA